MTKVVQSPSSDEQQEKGFNPRQKARGILDKARREALENKVKDKMKVIDEHNLSVNQLEREIDQMIEDYEQGL